MRLSNRFRTAVLGGLFILSALPAAHAACGAEKIGTARTIELDASAHKSFVGREKALGLRHKEVILTFDDGPLGGNTSSILKTLKHHCAKATFFYVGKMASTQPSLVRRVVRDGHTLGHHTWDHNRLPKYSSERAGELLDKGIATLDRIAYGRATGRATVPFFRYPYLARTKKTDKIIASRGLIAFDANIDSLDWKLKSTSAIHDRIMRRLKQDGKGIILMHDIHARTAKMLPRLLRSLKAGGYRIVHIVPKGKAAPVEVPVEAPVVVAAVDHETIEAKKSVRPAALTARQSGTDGATKPEPAQTRRVPVRLATQRARDGQARRRSGVIHLSTPSVVASSSITQLKPRKPVIKVKGKVKRKSVRVASISRKTRLRRKRLAKRRLRSSHWIIR